MSSDPRLRSSLFRLLPVRRSGAVYPALSVAALAAALLLLVAAVWPEAPARPSPNGEPAAGATAAQRDATATAPAGDAAATASGVEPIDRLTAGADPDEVARQLAEPPAGRWSYAFRSAPGRRPALPLPSPPPPRRVMPVLPASALGFAWPLRGVITSTFDDGHPLGIDIAPTDPLGLVLAARDGVVIAAGGDPCCGYGYYVMLDHGGGITSIYGHFREPPSFQPGERVERGTVLGVAGDTGHSYGVHLHFEVRVNGVPVDPQAALTGGDLTPLLVRLPAATPAPPDPETGDPHTIVPAPEESASPGGDPRIVNEEASPVAEESSPAAPAPSPRPVEPPIPTPSPAPATPAPTTASRAAPSSTPAPAPTATPVPQSPTVTPAPAVASTPAPSLAPGMIPVSPSPAAIPSPTASATPAPTPDSLTAPTSAPPRCETVRFPATDGFIVLEADPAAVQSLVAERCGPGAAVAVVARPIGELRCRADLIGQATSRHLPVTLVSAGSTPADQEGRPALRWTVEAEDVRPGTSVRVTCVSPDLPD